MGIFADSLFTALMSWVRALVSSIWALFTSDHTTLLGFLGKNWLMIVIAIVAAGLVIDWLVWLIRWQPYHIWALRLRRLLRLPVPEDDEPEEGRKLGKATAAKMPVKKSPQGADYVQTAFAVQSGADYGQYMRPDARMDTRANWLPLEQPDFDAQQAMRRADSVSDESLGAYPGMRYGTNAPERSVDDDTRRFSAVHNEGPGAAEVNRRRAEIDAWNAQMQEEARAQAEKKAREAEEARRAKEAYEAEQARLAKEAYEAEQARLAKEAYEAEQARLAKEAYEAEQARLAQEAYEAEQARLAQEEYERQMAEYERQKAEYERQMEEYNRQKAAYDAEMTRRQSEQQAAAYSAFVEGDDVNELPDAPDWPQMEMPQTGTPMPANAPKGKKQKKQGGFLDKMAKMLETDEEEISGINALPPRVNAQDAYRPATKPQNRTGRK